MRDDTTTKSEPTPAPKGGTPAQERKLRAQGKKTLSKLLKAARTAFGERGYNATRVDDIVKLAKTSHGTFYLYFSNKEDLLRALLEEVVEDMRELIESLEPIDPGPEGEQAVRDWLERYQDLYHDYWPVIHAWLEAENQGVEFGRMGREVLGRFAALFASRIREAGVDGKVDPDIAGLAFVAMIERIHYFVESRGIDFDREEMLDTLARIAHRGIFSSTS